MVKASDDQWWIRNHCKLDILWVEPSLCSFQKIYANFRSILSKNTKWWNFQGYNRLNFLANQKATGYCWEQWCYWRSPTHVDLCLKHSHWLSLNVQDCFTLQCLLFFTGRVCSIIHISLRIRLGSAHRVLKVMQKSASAHSHMAQSMGMNGPHDKSYPCCQWLTAMYCWCYCSDTNIFLASGCLTTSQIIPCF